MACKKDHSAIQKIMFNLPVDQGGKGRHKCAACAYEKGFEAGKELKEVIDLSEIFDSLEESEKEKSLMIAQLSHDIKTPITLFNQQPKEC